MSNVITNLIRSWIAGAFASNIVLRNSNALLLNVSRDFDNKPAIKGSKVIVPLPPIKTATAVTPSMTIPTPNDSTIDKREINLDQWYYTSFGVNDQELTQMEAGQYFSPVNAEACIVGLIDKMSDYMWGVTHGAYGFFGFTGTAGTTPFGSNTDIIADAKKIMSDNKSPMVGRKLIMDTAAENKALKLADFKDADKAGNSNVKVEGYLGRVGGFETFVDQQVPLHTTGAATAGTIALDDSAARAIGTTTLHMDGFSVKPSPGDVFTIAGDAQTYSVISSTTLAGTDSDVTFYPGLKVAIPAADGNEVVTFKASHRVNIAYHPAAIQLVTRPLVGPTQAAAEGIVNANNLIAQAEMTDPVTKITIRCSVYRGFGLHAFIFDALWGGEVVRSEMGLRFVG
jgi:P22 coat protein - gene protein 5